MDSDFTDVIGKMLNTFDPFGLAVILLFFGITVYGITLSKKIIKIMAPFILIVCAIFAARILLGPSSILSLLTILSQASVIIAIIVVCFVIRKMSKKK